VVFVREALVGREECDGGKSQRRGTAKGQEKQRKVKVKGGGLWFSCERHWWAGRNVTVGKVRDGGPQRGKRSKGRSRAEG